MIKRFYNTVHRPNARYFLWDQNGRHLSRKSVTNMLFSAQGTTCYICNNYMRRDQATIDHVVPLQLGGANALFNFALAHGECNKTKSASEPTNGELERHAAIQKKLKRVLLKASLRRAWSRVQRWLIEGR